MFTLKRFIFHFYLLPVVYLGFLVTLHQFIRFLAPAASESFQCLIVGTGIHTVPILFRSFVFSQSAALVHFRFHLQTLSILLGLLGTKLSELSTDYQWETIHNCLALYLYEPHQFHLWKLNPRIALSLFRICIVNELSCSHWDLQWDFVIGRDAPGYWVLEGLLKAPSG